MMSEMMMQNKDMPAAPCWDEETGCNFIGLTKREYFAAMAMQGILAGQDGWVISLMSIANTSVKQADELLKALEENDE